MDQRPGSSHEDRLRSESADRAVKSEHAVSSPQIAGPDLASASFKPSPTPLPSTEAPDSAAMAVASKKKGTATGVKKVPKRPGPGNSKRKKKTKTGSAAPGVDDASGEEESDNGPYCLCRGPDDHRWMICCEKCEDWFHGECINMNKEIGENLIEKFICPNCTTADLATIYKKTCALRACRKAARLAQSQPSVFCSNEHAQIWWERMISRLPKGRAKSGLNDQLAQDEFMALLSSDIGSRDEDGTWKLVKTPFSDDSTNGIEAEGDDALSKLLSDEEQKVLDEAAKARFELAEETLLCHKMFTLIELAQERRRAAITDGRFGDDICGYDSRLDAVSARDVFSAFIKSPEGEEVFKNSKLDDPLGEDDMVRGMCERKRCKTHSGWQKMLPLGVKHHIREMAGQAAEVEEEEQIVRKAVVERWKRRQAESNWVESLEE
ncbi:hypothetical protein MHUMG1_01132 [Metarhizium humberi]|uniref:PHD-type domain-containing protein n=4 Tax=Opisthokonta TaxID=33154 RepID=A0A9P8S9W2_9HYPO|nr:uncharacterized protein MAA_08433 [Metarhizium robertsii ARSEF 23]EFY96126.1 hypothetical protein MAA_08433 [Metarhizium robertsii ARSEF 23]EXU98349.1 PHD-finger domain protein [Metarhizium robertsii]KAH0600136.1 hypothetical protein MHUMG1_01132 [Metarhizium humberi]